MSTCMASALKRLNSRGRNTFKGRKGAGKSPPRVCYGLLHLSDPTKICIDLSRRVEPLYDRRKRKPIRKHTLKPVDLEMRETSKPAISETQPENRQLE